MEIDSLKTSSKRASNFDCTEIPLTLRVANETVFDVSAKAGDVRKAANLLLCGDGLECNDI